MSKFHQPVMLLESISGLKIKDGGVYVDVTFGGGGHASKILKDLKKGKLIVFDQDQEAIASNKIKDDRMIIMDKNFRYISNCLNNIGVAKIDGLIADLGVSSHQIDSDRGFSFNSNIPLDMRMNKVASRNAQDILNKYDKKSLSKIFKDHSDFTNSDYLAEKIVEYRKQKTITFSKDLLEAFRGSFFPAKKNKFFARIFQAIRIEVNDEIESLKKLLQSSLELLSPGGRLVVISYHSIEDRIVKNFMRFGKFESFPEKDFFGNPFRPFELINKKPILASSKEIEINNRARSAKLRIAEFKNIKSNNEYK